MTDNSEFSYYNIDFELKVTIDISKIFLSNFFKIQYWYFPQFRVL